MRKFVIILISTVFFGCTTTDKPLKKFTSSQVIEDNVLSFASVEVNVHPELNYNISGHIEKDKRWSDPTNREFNIFTHPGVNKIVVIETHSRRLPNSFQSSHSILIQHKAVIQKGSKPIDGNTWEVYTRALSDFPEYILSAIKQKGIRIEPYSCGLEMGVARELNRFSRIYVSYIEGVEKCRILPQNGNHLNGSQIRLMQNFVSRFEDNITITDRSDGK
jgi:hypothetical protein